MKTLRVSVEQQIKASEDVISKKLEAAEATGRPAISAKAKDKKK
jgi:hypothetical protein